MEVWPCEGGRKSRAAIHSSTHRLLPFNSIRPTIATSGGTTITDDHDRPKGSHAAGCDAPHELAKVAHRKVGKVTIEGADTDSALHEITPRHQPDPRSVSHIDEVAE